MRKAGGVRMRVSRNRFGVSGPSEPPSGLEPVSLVTSVTHRSQTFTFDRPVLAGYYADGQPFVISDREFAWTGSTTPSVGLVSGAYTNKAGTSIPAGAVYVAHGAMVNPYLRYIPPGSATVTCASQGFDEIFTVQEATMGGAKTINPVGADGYIPALNVDPGVSGPYAVTVGREVSIVKSVRWPGYVTPDNANTHREIADWCVFHIVPEAKRPPLGGFAPGASDPDKTSRYTLSMRNKACLGDGFALSAGMPSLATTVGAGAFTPFQPFFGQGGEIRQRFMTLPMTLSTYDGNPGLTTYSGNSNGFGIAWSDHVAAILAQGQAVDDAVLNDALAFGLQLLGLYNVGDKLDFGAGQWCGHQQFVMLLGFMFHGSDPTLMAKCLDIKGNALTPFRYVGFSEEGISRPWPGNHDRYFGTFTAEHIGRPWWGGDGEPNADYEFTSNISDFLERTNIFLLKEGPGGVTGAQLAAASSTNGVKAAAHAYQHRYRSLATSNIWSANLGSMAVPRSLAYFDDRKADFGDVPWTGAPEGGTIYAGTVDLTLNSSGLSGSFVAGETVTAPGGYKSTVSAWVGGATRKLTVIDNNTPWPIGATVTGQTSGATGVVGLFATGRTQPFLTPIVGGFSWNLASLFQATEEILEYQIQYSLDQKMWVDVAAPGVSGSQTGLAVGAKHYVRWRRRSASGWGTWSVNYPIIRGYVERLLATPLGTPSGAPVCVVAPKVAYSKYPQWLGPLYVEAASPIDLTKIAVLQLSLGYWTGDLSSGFTLRLYRDGVQFDTIPIIDGTEAFYALTGADAGTTFSYDVTCNGVTQASNSVSIPALPALPASIHIEHGFDASFSLYFSEELASVRENSDGNFFTLTTNVPTGGTALTAGESVSNAFGAVGTVVSHNVTSHVLVVKFTGAKVFKVGQVLTGATSGVTATVTLIGNLQKPPVELLPDYIRIADDEVTVITESILRVNKNGSSPILRGNFTKRKPLVTGRTYRATLAVPISVDGGFFANLTVKAGSTAGTTSSPGNNYYSNTAIEAATVREEAITFTFVAVGPDFWLSLRIPTGTGNYSGGNPALAYIKVEDITL